MSCTNLAAVRGAKQKLALRIHVVCDLNGITIGSTAHGSQQVASQHLAGGGDFRRIAEGTDRPDGHLDPLSGAIGKLRPEQIDGKLGCRTR